MPTKTRLANKTQWTLLDIIARSKAARVRWHQAMKMAERNLDPAMVYLLAGLRDDLAVIEALAKDGLNGEYEGGDDDRPRQRHHRGPVRVGALDGLGGRVAWGGEPMSKHYEHRISPTDPQIVEVREDKARRSEGRGISWRTYMDCDSRAAANRILMMLKHDNVEATVLP